MTVEIGDSVLLRLKNKSNTRCPKGIISGIIYSETDIDLILRLTEDYIGKNEEWFKGEEKLFKGSEIKTICKL